MLSLACKRCVDAYIRGVAVVVRHAACVLDSACVGSERRCLPLLTLSRLRNKVRLACWRCGCLWIWKASDRVLAGELLYTSCILKRMVFVSFRWLCLQPPEHAGQMRQPRRFSITRTAAQHHAQNTGSSLNMFIVFSNPCMSSCKRPRLFSSSSSRGGTGKHQLPIRSEEGLLLRCCCRFFEIQDTVRNT